MHLRSGRLLPSNQDSTDQGLEDEDKDATVAKKQNKTKKTKKMQASFFFFSVVAQFKQLVYPDFYFMLLYVEINQNPHIMTLFFTINSRKEKTLFSRDFICCFYPPFRDKKPL